MPNHTEGQRRPSSRSGQHDSVDRHWAATAQPWARPLGSRAAYKRFREMLDHCLEEYSAQGPGYRFDRTAGVVAGDDGSLIDLAGLVRRLGRVSIPQWESEVRRQIESWLIVCRARPSVADWSVVKPRLRVRLGVRSSGLGWLNRPAGDATQWEVVVDCGWGSVMAPLGLSGTKRGWNQSADQVWALALDNTLAEISRSTVAALITLDGATDGRSTAHPTSEAVLSLTGPYAASLLLDPRSLVRTARNGGLQPELGPLRAVTTGAHCLLVTLPIDDNGPGRLIQALICAATDTATPPTPVQFVSIYPHP